MSVTGAFPADWLCSLTVRRSGGRNADGDPVDATEHVIPECLVARRASSEPVDRTEDSKTTATAYGPPRADIVDTDTVVVPDDHFMAGEYRVDGDPGFWPQGTEIPLRRI